MRPKSSAFSGRDFSLFEGVKRNKNSPLGVGDDRVATDPRDVFRNAFDPAACSNQALGIYRSTSATPMYPIHAELAPNSHASLERAIRPPTIEVSVERIA
jgi:hypothetical protein